MAVGPGGYVRRRLSRSATPVRAMSRVRRRYCLALALGILLLAGALRFHRLGAQSLWNDEGNSARISERAPTLILAGAGGDIHPPGYYLALHYWRAAFGQSEFSLRSVSAFAGVVLVALTFRLGRGLLGRDAGLIAALLAAVSPFAIYYSQEARAYVPLAALGAAATILATQMLDSLTNRARRRGRILWKGTLGLWATAYALTSAAGLYTHYAFPAVLLAHNCTFAAWWIIVARGSERRYHQLATWIVVQAATLCLYLPWLQIALRSVTGWPSAGSEVNLGTAFLDVLRLLTVGTTLPAEQATAGLIGAGAMLVAGLWPDRSPYTGTGQSRYFPSIRIASVALYLLVPVGFLIALDLYKPAWLKFLVVVLPPFHVLVARGIQILIHTRGGGRARFAIPVLAAGVLAANTLSSLRNLYVDPVYARDNYRQIASDISAEKRAGDAIILNAPNQWEVFTYYFSGQDIYPSPYQPDSSRVEAFLAPLSERYDRLLALYWGDAESDPARLIETWLALHAYKSSDRWYGRVRLATYGVTSPDDMYTVPIDAAFGPTILLQAYTRGDSPVAQGSVVPVTLFWTAEAPVAERYKVTVQLLDGEGRLVAQHDGEPSDGLAPTNVWLPGKTTADRHGIALPPNLPPGGHALTVSLYHLVSGKRLTVVVGDKPVGDSLSIGHVEIKP